MIDFNKINTITDKKGFEIFLESQYDSEYENCILDISRGLNHLLKTDLMAAQKYLAHISQIFSYIPEKYAYRLITFKARYELWSGDYKAGLKHYKTALIMTMKRRKYREAALIRKGMIEVYMYLGQYEDGIMIGKKALEYFRNKKMENDAAQALTNIGNIYHRMDKNRQALQYYDKARLIFEKNGGLPLAIVDYNRANIYANLNQLAKAKELYLEAGYFYKKAGMDLAWEQAEYSIAYLLFLESKYTDAIRLFEKAYDSFERLGDISSSIVTQLDLAELNIQLNQYGTTIMLCEDIIPKFHELNMTYEEGKAYYFIAVAKLELGDIEQSEQLLDQSEDIFIKEKNDLWLGMIQFARNRVYIAKKNYELAIGASVEAQLYFGKSKDIRRQHDAEIAHIEALFKLGQKSKAMSRINTFIKQDITLDQERRVRYLTGEYYYENREYEKALKEFQKAVKIVEKMLSGLYLDEVRFFFAVDKYHIYARIVECYLHLGKTELSYLSNLQALSLLNEKVISEKQILQNIPVPLIQEVEQLRQLLVQSYKFPQKGSRIMERAGEVQKIERRLWQLERKIRSYRTDTPEIQRTSDRKKELVSLKANEVVVNFFYFEDTVGAFVNYKSEVRFVPFDISTKKLQELIRKLQFVLEHRVSGSFFESADDIADAYLQRLYKLIIQPLALREETADLYIIPDAIFNQIPFHALKNSEGIYLKDLLNIRIIIDPKDILKRRSRRTDFTSKKNAIFSVTSEALPQVDNEGKKIKQEFRDALFMSGEKANIKSFKKELSHANGFLHIAAHASRSSENPLFSRILLSDGVFFPFDLFDSGVKPELVTLSGCQTAAPGLNYGNTFSLAKAFYRSGSRYVLASLWPVDDNVTMLFMSEFYKQLKHCSVPDAYYRAVNYLALKINDPAYWGAFVLIGK